MSLVEWLSRGNDSGIRGELMRRAIQMMSEPDSTAVLEIRDFLVDVQIGLWGLDLEYKGAENKLETLEKSLLSIEFCKAGLIC